MNYFLLISIPITFSLFLSSLILHFSKIQINPKQNLPKRAPEKNSIYGSLIFLGDIIPKQDFELIDFYFQQLIKLM